MGSKWIAHSALKKRKKRTSSIFVISINWEGSKRSGNVSSCNEKSKADC